MNTFRLIAAGRNGPRVQTFRGYGDAKDAAEWAIANGGVSFAVVVDQTDGDRLQAIFEVGEWKDFSYHEVLAVDTIGPRQDTESQRAQVEAGVPGIYLEDTDPPRIV